MKGILWRWLPEGLAFRLLVWRAARAASTWRLSLSDTVRCANGRCLLGALIIKAGGDPTDANNAVPEPLRAAARLSIPARLAERVIVANDNQSFDLDRENGYVGLAINPRDRAFVLRLLQLQGQGGPRA